MTSVWRDDCLGLADALDWSLLEHRLRQATRPKRERPLNCRVHAIRCGLPRAWRYRHERRIWQYNGIRIYNGAGRYLTTLKVLRSGSGKQVWKRSHGMFDGALGYRDLLEFRPEAWRPDAVPCREDHYGFFPPYEWWKGTQR